MKIAFTVDLEPDWGIPNGPCQVLSEVLPDFLAWLAERCIRATFFTVAEMVKRFPDSIGKIAEQHEIASHGLSHQRLELLDEKTVIGEIRDSKQILEDVAGRPVSGFRTPYLVQSDRVMNLIKEAGYRYDSSRGACAPSLANALLPKGAGPFRHPNGMVWLPICTMRDGLNPFCLTALRVGYPWSLYDLPSRPRMFFLHLHELSGLPVPEAAGGRIRRALLRRGQGDAAWMVLKKMIQWYQNVGAEWVSCEDFIADSCEEGDTR